MKPLVIIGLGNRWCSDDGIGLELVDAVAACHIEAIECRAFESADALTLAHEMLELDAPCLIVDCADMGEEPGSSRYFSESDVKLGSARSTHGFGIAEALPLVRALGFTHAVNIFGVQPYSMAMAQGCSSPMRAELSNLLESLLEHIQQSLYPGGRSGTHG